MVPRILSNPFFIYILSFGLVLIVYMFGWSALYPDLSASLIIFFLLTFSIALYFGVVADRFKRIQFQPIKGSSNIAFVCILMWLIYFAEFAYNGGIPLVMVLQGDSSYDYRLFGIPTLHVILITFNCFYSVFLFHQLVSKFSRKTLFYLLFSTVPMILIVSRGMLFVILTGCLFVFLLSLKHIRLRTIVRIGIAALVVFYFFGIIGNLRQANETSSKYMLEISKATPNFRESFIPDEYIWAYMYISSPLANFQNTINNCQHCNTNVASFLNYEFLPDFISKRTGEFFDIEKGDVPRIADWLTVSTFYARPYYFLGWWGLIIMFVFFITTTLLYIFLIKKSSPYYITGLAIINTIILFNTFDNMYAFTGLSFQLIYPIIFTYFKVPSLKFTKTTQSINE